MSKGENMVERGDEALGVVIARNARGFRKAHGLTLQEVADRAGLAKSYVWELEQGKQTNPSITKLMALAKALGCSLDRLVGADKFLKPQLRPEAMRIAVQVDELLRAALRTALSQPNDEGEGK